MECKIIIVWEMTGDFRSVAEAKVEAERLRDDFTGYRHGPMRWSGEATVYDVHEVTPQAVGNE